MADTDSPGVAGPPSDGAVAPSGGGRACVCWPERDRPDDRWVHEKLAAEPETVRALRSRMRSWVDVVGLDEEMAESVVLVVDEAVTNAVEHACPDWDCHVELVAGPRACDGGVAVLVADNGIWQEEGDPGFRGRGVALIGRLSDRSTIDAGNHGTTVRMCWAVGASPT